MRSRVTPNVWPTSSSVHGGSRAGRSGARSPAARARGASGARARCPRAAASEAVSNGDSAWSSCTKSPSPTPPPRRSASPARPGAAPCAGSRAPPPSRSRALADLVGPRLAAQPLHELALDVHDLVELLDHVDGDADRPRLVGDRTRHRLPDPPGRVRRELVAAPVVELLDGADQAERPFLDQVEEGQPAPRYAFAIETTSRRFASIICRFATMSPRSMRLAR